MLLWNPHVAFVALIMLSVIKIPVFCPVSSKRIDADYYSCPTRTLKIHMDMTKEYRKDCQLIFVSYKAGHKGTILKRIFLYGDENLVSQMLTWECYFFA